LARITGFDILLPADAGRRAGDEGRTERAYERDFPCETKIFGISVESASLNDIVGEGQGEVVSRHLKLFRIYCILDG
jgi:hypothetical protein